MIGQKNSQGNGRNEISESDLAIFLAFEMWKSSSVIKIIVRQFLAFVYELWMVNEP